MFSVSSGLTGHACSLHRQHSRYHIAAEKRVLPHSNCKPNPISETSVLLVSIKYSACWPTLRQGLKLVHCGSARAEEGSKNETMRGDVRDLYLFSIF